MENRNIKKRREDMKERKGNDKNSTKKEGEAKNVKRERVIMKFKGGELHHHHKELVKVLILARDIPPL